MYPELSTADYARIWLRILPPDENGCRDWAGAKFSWGYGRIKIRGRFYGVHRLAFLISGGVLTPERPLVCHRCNRPVCCEPTHLYADSHTGNMRYMGACGRAGAQANPQRVPRGDRHWSRRLPALVARGARLPHTKLTAHLATVIRTRYAAGGVTQSQLAREFGVVPGTISKVIRRWAWPDAP